ncbi:MAG: hypothetical protein RIE08_08200 [Acidimicrobiales bacterium]
MPFRSDIVSLLDPSVESPPATPSGDPAAVGGATQRGAGHPDIVRVEAWLDPIVDELGVHPRSAYVEAFWLPVIGPSCTWLIRRVTTGLDAHPDGYEMRLDHCAAELGIGGSRSKNATFARTVDRCAQFGLMRRDGRSGLQVRRRLPPLNRGHVRRLPERLIGLHERWGLESPRPDGSELAERAKRVALALFESGDDVEAVERQLHRWHFHPAMAHAAVRWADDYRRAGREAA